MMVRNLMTEPMVLQGIAGFGRMKNFKSDRAGVYPVLALLLGRLLVE